MVGIDQLPGDLDETSLVTGLLRVVSLDEGRRDALASGLASRRQVIEMTATWARRSRRATKSIDPARR